MGRSRRDPGFAAAVKYNRGRRQKGLNLAVGQLNRQTSQSPAQNDANWQQTAYAVVAGMIS
jgi:hypothetical protein